MVVVKTCSQVAPPMVFVEWWLKPFLSHIMLLYSLMLDYMYHNILKSALKIILTQNNNTVKQ